MSTIRDIGRSRETLRERESAPAEGASRAMAASVVAEPAALHDTYIDWWPALWHALVAALKKESDSFQKRVRLFSFAAPPAIQPPPPDPTPPPYVGYVTVLLHNEPGQETDLRWQATAPVRRGSRGAARALTGQFVTARRDVPVTALNALLTQYPITQVQRGIAQMTEAQLTIGYAYL